MGKAIEFRCSRTSTVSSGIYPPIIASAMPPSGAQGCWVCLVVWRSREHTSSDRLPWPQRVRTYKRGKHRCNNEMPRRLSTGCWAGAVSPCVLVAAGVQTRMPMHTYDTNNEGVRHRFLSLFCAWRYYFPRESFRIPWESRLLKSNTRKHRSFFHSSVAIVYSLVSVLSTTTYCCSPAVHTAVR